MTLDIDQIEADLNAGRPSTGLMMHPDHRSIRQLLAEVKRLRAEVERLQDNASPKPGFLTWLNELSDLLPVGTVIGVKVEELQRWFEAGMTVEGAAERVRREGRRSDD